MSNSSASECPKCDRPTLRRSKSWFKHIYRRIKGSKSRYCKHCKIKWYVTVPPSIAFKVTLITTGFVSVFAVLFVVLSSLDPVNMVKRSVVSNYKKNKGSNAKTAIKKDLGFLYKNDSDRENDFQNHEK